MKYNIKKIDKPQHQRIIEAFFNSLWLLLEKISFQKMEISDICILAKYSRSTFYNYFNDKFDLMDSFWEYYFNRINYGEITSVNTLINFLCDFFYDYSEKYTQKIKIIISLNQYDSYIYTSYSNAVENIINKYIVSIERNTIINIPNKIFSKLLKDATFTLFKENFINNNYLSKDYIINILSSLFN